MPNSSPSSHKKITKRGAFLLIVIVLFTLSFVSILTMAQEHSVTVNVAELNVRSGPGQSHEVITQLYQNDHLHVLAEQDGWLKVRTSNNEIGWVTESFVENQAPREKSSHYLMGEVISPTLNVRSNHSLDSEIIGELTEGDQVDIIGQVDDWTEINYGDQTAWISSDYVKLLSSDTRPDDSEKTITMLEHNANIRRQPSLEADIIGEAFANQSYTYVQKIDQWYEIQLTENTTGFVHADYAHTTDIDDLDLDTIVDIPALEHATILIDPGHGGTDPGAVYNDTYEKDIALSTSLYLQQQLEKAGATVLMTRTSDIDVGLDERANISNTQTVDAFVSIHYDATGIRNSISGTTTYHYSDMDLPLANAINDRLKSDGQLSNNGIGFGNYHVLRNNTRPSVLLELGYMDNDSDYNIISTKNYHKNVADVIFKGLTDYFD